MTAVSFSIPRQASGTKNTLVIIHTLYPPAATIAVSWQPTLQLDIFFLLAIQYGEISNSFFINIVKWSTKLSQTYTNYLALSLDY